MQINISHEFIDNTEFLVFKPNKDITDSEYDEIKPYMEKMGGHWRERVKAFVFSLDSLKRNEYSQWKEDTQFFPTPKNIAKRAVKLSGVRDYSYKSKTCILEPSAGQGGLLDIIHNYVDDNIDEYIVEPIESNADILAHKGYSVERKTFEDFYDEHKDDEKHITHVIMNPPFSHSRDIKHTMMAFELLKSGGTLISIISENALYYDNEYSNIFKDWCKKNNAYIESIPYGSFKDSGTTVDTVIIKVVKE